MFTIGIIQDHADADARSNLRRAERLVRDAAGRGAQIICLKELFNALYFCKSQQCDRFDLAEPIPGPTTDAMQKLARELSVVIVVPIFERQTAGLYRNSAAIVDADGSLLGVYRKMHIPDDPLFHEKYYFTPGDGHLDYHGEQAGEAGGSRVWKTRYATIGVLICWDQWYPEAARAMMLQRAEILLYPTAIGSEPYDLTLDTHARWQRAMQGHAVANAVPVVAANRIGVEQNDGATQSYYGHSFIANHAGELVASFGDKDEGVLAASFDLGDIERYRAEWGFFRDRRTDLYAKSIL